MKDFHNDGFVLLATPNGHKITIFFEESDLPYKLIPINIFKGEQFFEDFLRISPNNRIPAIVDHNPKDISYPISIFESGAILLYLAEKTASRLGHLTQHHLEFDKWEIYLRMQL